MRAMTWNEHKRLSKFLKRQKTLIENALGTVPKTSKAGKALWKSYELNGEVRNELDNYLLKTNKRGDAVYMYFGDFPKKTKKSQP